MLMNYKKCYNCSGTKNICERKFFRLSSSISRLARIFLYVVSLTLTFLVTICVCHDTFSSPVSDVGDPFYIALQGYFTQNLTGEPYDSRLKPYLGDFALADLDGMIIEFGADTIQQTTQWFSANILL